MKSSLGYDIRCVVILALLIIEFNALIVQQSFCDPRLNFEQSLGALKLPFIVNIDIQLVLDVAFLISKHYKDERRGKQKGMEKDVLFTELSGKPSS